MSETDEFKVVLVNENDSQSILSDAFTFGCLFGGFWVNYEYIGNGTVLQIVLGLCFFLWAHARSTKKIKHMTASEALEYLTARAATGDK